MLIANPKRSALGLLNLDPRVLITRMLVGAAVVLGSCVVGAAPASADPQSSATTPNPFAALGCGCKDPALAGSSVRTEFDRGIRDGSLGLVGTPRTQ